MSRRPSTLRPSALLLFLLLLAPLALAEAPPPEHEETKQLMALVGDAAALIAEVGEVAACEQFHEKGSRWFHDDVYVFVNDLEGNSLCHPAKPSLEGKGLLDLRDPHGKPIVQSFNREVADDGEGWVHYLWPPPGGGMNFFWKTSYVRKATTPEGVDLVVGSGLYQMPMERMFVVEQVEDAVELIEAKGEESFAELRDKASGFRFYDSYLFVMDAASGVHLVNAAFPEREGTVMIDFTDENGKVIGREMLALLETADSGWVDYMWPRPGDERSRQKSAYVRKVTLADGRALVVGAGIYVD